MRTKASRYLLILTILASMLLNSAQVYAADYVYEYSTYEGSPVPMVLGTRHYYTVSPHNPAYYYYTFTPETTGVYEISNTDYMAMGFNFYTGSYNNTDISTDFLTYTAIGSNGPSQKNRYLLKGGTTHKFYIETNGMESSRTHYFTIKKTSISKRATLTDAAPLTLSREYSESIYYDFISIIPNKTGNIAVDITYNKDEGTGFICMLDMENGDTYSAGYYAESSYYSSKAQASISVIAGKQYYITLSGMGYGATTLNLEYLPEADNTTVYTSDIADLKSAHRYGNNLDKKWVYTPENPETIALTDITFSKETFFDWDYWYEYSENNDFLYIYDAAENVIGCYTRDDLSGKTISVPSGSFTLHFVTSASNVDYGFEVTDIKAYTELPPPKIEYNKYNLIKLVPHNNAGTPYYKIVTNDSETEFTQFSENTWGHMFTEGSYINAIDKDTVIYAYTEYGDKKSKTVSFIYDREYVAPPKFTVAKDSSGTTKLYLSADAGTIYYRAIGDWYFDEVYSGPLSYGSNIEACTVLNGIKSDSVYYTGTAANTTEDTTGLGIPVITQTPVLGGMKVTITPPKETTLGFTRVSENYVDDHYISNTELCSQHTMDRYYSTRDIYTLEYYDKDEGYYSRHSSYEPVTLTYYEDNIVYSFIEHYHDYEEGDWSENIVPANYHGKWEDYSKGYFNRKTAPTNSNYIIIPKATAPIIRLDGTKALITADEGLLIYYSINGGEFKEYTSPLTVKKGDAITAYAIGYGIAKSPSSKETVTGESKNALEITVNSTKDLTPGATLPLQIKNYFGAEKGTLFVKIYDKTTNTLESVQSKQVNLYPGTRSIYLDADFKATNKAPYISVYFWDNVNGMKPITERINLPLNK